MAKVVYVSYPIVHFVDKKIIKQIASAIDTNPSITVYIKEAN